MAYTTIDDPSAHFHTQLYSGDGNTNRDITNDANAGDFRPDFLWLKNRTDNSTQHMLFNSNVGMPNHLNSDLLDAEQTATNKATAFNADGFRVQDHSQVNASGKNYVAWQWKANGGTTTTNDASATSVGTIDSVYQANTTAGFSIVTYTGTGSAGTIAHGVGATPHWVLVKNRSSGSTQWYNQHIGNSSASKGQTLSTNGAEQTLSAVFNDTRASSTVFSVGNNNSINDSGDNYVAYIFAPIKGYSKFGSYTGNGNADGPFVYTGFKPSWIMLKRIDSTNNWNIFDSKRDVDNQVGNVLYANLTNAEEADASHSSANDFLSNGFKLRETGNAVNGSGASYIYIAFAEHPFVSSKGVPVTAR